jgi:hypothetical protein
MILNWTEDESSSESDKKEFSNGGVASSSDELYKTP